MVGVKLVMARLGLEGLYGGGLWVLWRGLVGLGL